MLGARLVGLLLGGGIGTSIGLVAGAAIDAFASHPRGSRNASDAAGFPREQSVTAPMIAVSAAATMES